VMLDAAEGGRDASLTDHGDPHRHDLPAIDAASR
jgi:hypothetical protein